MRLHWTDFYSLIQELNPNLCFAIFTVNLQLNENDSFTVFFMFEHFLRASKRNYEVQPFLLICYLWLP